MNRPQKREGFSDLVPGLAAAGAFVVMFLLLHSWNLIWVSALLSLAVYFGVKLLLPAPQPEVVPALSTRQILDEVYRLSQQMPSGRVQNRLAKILETANAVLVYGEAHPDKAGESLFVVRQYLDLTCTGLRRSLEARRYTTGTQSQEKLVEVLDSVQETFTHLHSRLLQEEDTVLTGELQALKQNMQELDVLFLNLGGEKKE